jgi:hypothetical protein
MAENRNYVYSNAMLKYRELLEKGDGAKREYLASRARIVEENKRFDIETRQK